MPLPLGTVRDIVQGAYVGLEAPRSTIDIFLSSTFTDFTFEHDHILQHCLPRLRAYAHQRDLAFDISSLRWEGAAPALHQSTRINPLERLAAARLLLLMSGGASPMAWPTAMPLPTSALKKCHAALLSLGPATLSV
jgi:hypothetical protein